MSSKKPEITVGRDEIGQLYIRSTDEWAEILKEEYTGMKLREIELSKALTIIGAGNPAKELYCMKKDQTAPDILNFDRYKIEARHVNNYRWFVID